ncbi:hypothetical protein [Dactylosporangium aurantiacum]|uniref:hypothetical protein n=1 Tax=Dactylosporangium aurantiacum TaxID=35754 RepID=UPI000527F3E9|nr:hypothetical protein [Dactylosporangium aurantiacum]
MVVRSKRAAGGFLGTDPALSEAQLRRYVETGRLRYILSSPMDRLAIGATSPLSAWAAAHCRVVEPAEYSPGGGPAGPAGARPTLYDCAA